MFLQHLDGSKIEVSQGSVLGAFLSNIYINGLFLFTDLIDDTTVHAVDDNVKNVVDILEGDANILGKANIECGPM